MQSVQLARPHQALTFRLAAERAAARMGLRGHLREVRGRASLVVLGVAAAGIAAPRVFLGMAGSMVVLAEPVATLPPGL